jgi:4-alpha-glucanotransferase
MKKTKLILGITNQQPDGLGSGEYEKEYQSFLKPFLRTLYNFEEIPMTFYFSGSLLEWLEARHPEVTMILNEMVKRKQVELLGGGFFDPILPVIPNSDRSGQIEALTTLLRKRFGKRPRGGWLTEMVWEPSVPMSLKNSGLDYIFLDDTYLKVAGLRGDELSLPCLTEDQGKSIRIFPINVELRQSFLEADPDQSYAQLLTIKKRLDKSSRKEDHVITVFIDKNNLSIGTEDGHVWESHPWWDRFFSHLLEDRENFQPLLPSQHHKTGTGGKKIYFPCLLPSSLEDRQGRDARRASFRSYLTEFAEIDLFYSKMIYISSMVNLMKGDRSRKKSARTELWRAQGNRMYWYPPDEARYYRILRRWGWEAVLEAEKLTREKGIFQPSLIKTDFDMDGREEYLFQGNHLNCYVHCLGAALFELDYLDKAWNYQDTLCHWMRPDYVRNSLVDSFVYSSPSPEKDTVNPDLSHSLDTLEFTDIVLDKEKKRVIFTAETSVPDDEGRLRQIKLSKTYQFYDDGLEVSYDITNLQDRDFSFKFVTSMSLNFSSDEGAKLAVNYVSRGKDRVLEEKRGLCRDVKTVNFRDGHLKTTLDIESSKNFELNMNRLLIEDAMDGTAYYQGTGLNISWKKRVGPFKTWSVTLSLKLRRQENKKTP